MDDKINRLKELIRRLSRKAGIKFWIKSSKRCLAAG